ncbi:MAG: hypothetical protein NTY74_08530 [Ignavibacteriae bacterium]|nr:hypothetical protein [Ignavibacteriota bacterium]
MDNRDKYTEKMAKRMYFGSNMGMGCGLALALLLLIGLAFMCSIFK